MYAEERQYIEQNRAEIEEHIKRERIRKAREGKDFDGKSFMRDFLIGLREGTVSVNGDIHQQMRSRSNSQNYTVPLPSYEIGLEIGKALVRAMYTREEKELFAQKYQPNLENTVRSQQPKHHPDQLTYYINMYVTRLHGSIKKYVEERKATTKGQLTRDDVRRLKRLKYQVGIYTASNPDSGLKLKDNIDGTSKSHILAQFTGRDGKPKTYIVTPEKMVERTPSGEMKLVYKRESINHTLTGFKQGMSRVARVLNPRQLRDFLEIVGTSYDLRKTVKTTSGNRL